MNAVLVIIGDEILSGNTMDTNSSFIATELKNIGIKISQIFTISDETEVIKSTLKSALENSDLIITTGGLGPTKDDKTKKAFAEFFNDEIVLDEKTFAHLKQLLEKRNRAHLLEINVGQAEVLSKAKVIQNENGTAPCQMIEQNGKTVFCLPGVPYEVKPLIKNKIIPLLKEKFRLESIVSRIISVVDIPESQLALQIENWELSLPENISLSYLPVGNRIKLRLTAFGENEFDLNEILNQKIKELEKLIGGNIISKNGDSVQEILFEILKNKNLTISSAESCTGGEISRLLTSVSGISKYFAGGICTYKTEKKSEILQVQKEMIDEFSVVSEEVAKAMSLGCQNLFQTDISVSTTGVAGPNSDEFNNEIGLVYYSIRIKNFEKTSKLFLPHLERGDFMNFVSQRVLQDVISLLVLPENNVKNS